VCPASGNATRAALLRSAGSLQSFRYLPIGLEYSLSRGRFALSVGRLVQHQPGEFASAKRSPISACVHPHRHSVPADKLRFIFALAATLRFTIADLLEMHSLKTNGARGLLATICFPEVATTRFK